MCEVRQERDCIVQRTSRLSRDDIAPDRSTTSSHYRAELTMMTLAAAEEEEPEAKKSEPTTNA